MNTDDRMMVICGNTRGDNWVRYLFGVRDMPLGSSLPHLMCTIPSWWRPPVEHNHRERELTRDQRNSFSKALGLLVFRWTSHLLRFLSLHRTLKEWINGLKSGSKKAKVTQENRYQEHLIVVRDEIQVVTIWEHKHIESQVAKWSQCNVIYIEWSVII